MTLFWVPYGIKKTTDGSGMAVVIKLKKNGSLSKHGYGVSVCDTKRHRSLKAAVKEYGSSYVIKKLGVLAIYRKNTPKLKKQFETLRDDMVFVQKLRNALSVKKRRANLAVTRHRLATRNQALP
jgi:hypothetical protein